MTLIMIMEKSLEMLHSSVRAPILKRNLSFERDLSYFFPK